MIAVYNKHQNLVSSCSKGSKAHSLFAKLINIVHCSCLYTQAKCKKEINNLVRDLDLNEQDNNPEREVIVTEDDNIDSED